MKNRLCMALGAAAAVVVLGTAGCTDTTVEPKSTITDANVFNDPASYKAFVAKLYAGLQVSGQQGPHGAGDIRTGDEGFSQYLRLLWEANELPTDEAIIGWNDTGLPELNTLTWGETNGFLIQMYYRVFYQVALANEFLRQTTDDKLAARNLSDAWKAQIKTYRAEARFLRALSYWHGLDLFANIPLVDENSPVGATPPPQATRTQLYDFVVSELNAIKADLPPKAGNYGRATPGAADMLLAHLYLNSAVYTGTARYSEARAAAEAVINGGGYSLATNYRQNFVADNNNSPEIIFAIPQDGQKTKTWGGLTFLIHASCGGSLDDGNRENVMFGIDGCWWGLRIKQQAYQLFGPGDTRGSHFWTQGQNVAVTKWDDWSSGVASPKFSNRTLAGAAGSDATHPDTDFPMFRLADAYLIYAEAVVRGGGGTRAQALTYINALRQRAFGNTSGNITDGQMTLDFILAERGRELLWEGHRRQDLIRFGKFTGGDYIWAYKGGTPAGASVGAHLAIYPIPQNELIANPNLTQNPGY